MKTNEKVQKEATRLLRDSQFGCCNEEQYENSYQFTTGVLKGIDMGYQAAYDDIMDWLETNDKNCEIKSSPVFERMRIELFGIFESC